MAYTLEQLQQMGAKPITTPVQPVASSGKKSYTLQELQSSGAKPITEPVKPVDTRKPFEKAGDYLATARFGRTIGEVFAAPSGIKEFNDAMKSFNDVNQNIVNAIKNARETGQDTTRLESLLQEQQSKAPKIEQFLGDKAADLINKTQGQAARQIAGEALGTFGEAIMGGGISGVGKLTGAAGLVTRPTLKVAAEAALSQLPSAVSMDVGQSLESGKVETPINTIISTITPFGIAGIGKGIQAVRKAGNFASLSEAQKVVDDISGNLEALVGSGQAAEKRLGKFRRTGTARFLVENGYLPEVKDGRIVTDSARERIQDGIGKISEEVTTRAVNDPTLFGKTGILSGMRGAIDESGDVMGTLLPKQKDFITKEAQVFLEQVGQTGESVGTQGILQLRQHFDDIAKASFDPLTKVVSARGLAARNAADYLRTIIREGVQDKTIGDLLKLESELYAADEFLSPKGIGGKVVKGGRMTELIARMIGGTVSAVATSGSGGVSAIVAGAVGQEAAGQAAKAIAKMRILNPIQRIKLSRLTNSVLDLLDTGNLDQAVARRIEQKSANKTAQEVADIIQKEAPEQLNKFQKAVNAIAIKRRGDFGEPVKEYIKDYVKNPKMGLSIQDISGLSDEELAKIGIKKNNLSTLEQEAKKYKSAEEFVKAHTASDLMDLSNPEKHRIGRLFSKADDDKIMDTFDMSKVYGSKGNNEYKYQPSANVPDVKSPEEMVTIYRGTVKKQKEIMPGDFVSFSKEYALMHNNGEKLLTLKVPAKDVIWQGNDLHEWVYSPKEIRDKYGSLEEIWKKANKK